MNRLPARGGNGPEWSVTALVRAVADELDARFNPVAVRGELSGFTRAASGHCYFALKDATSQLRCAMFRRAAGLLAFDPADGDAVEVRGRVAVYEARGDLQLIVESMRPVGQGTLLEQFLRLKARLEAEGLFDPARKRPIAPLPRAVGVVSSLAAAALHDVLTALARRAPHVRVVVYPAAVQGAQAPAELVAAIRAAGERREVDTLLVCRGGGALEDLWSFNDEAVARAIAASPIPVVSGVGHETDFTLADFAADLRAPTPTAAAELAAAPREALLDGVAALAARLARAVTARLDGLGQRLDRAAFRLRPPAELLRAERDRLAQAERRLAWSMREDLLRRRHALAVLEQRLPGAGSHVIEGGGQRLALLQARLAALDPGRVLSRGYAWVTDGEGRVVTSVAQLAPGDTMHAALADGTVDASVLAVHPGLPR